MKKIWIGIVCLLSAMPASAEVVTVDGWIVNDDSFPPDASGTFRAIGFTAPADLKEKNGWLAKSRYDFADKPGGFAEWRFLNLPAGTYEVAVSYQAARNRSKVAPYTVQGGVAIPVNQQKDASGGPTLNDGTSDIPFKIITSTAIVNNGTLRVRLDDIEKNTGMDFVIADAVAIRAVKTEKAHTAENQ